MRSADQKSVPSPIGQEGRLTVKVGPFGAPHRDGYVEWDDGSHFAVEWIFLSYTRDVCINSIQAQYRDPAGTQALKQKHGGAGKMFELIQIKSAITWVSGHYDSLDDITVIRSLKFGTKEGQTHGPYGSGRGTQFSFKVGEDGICGFHGLKDDSGLRALGVHFYTTAKQHLGPSVNSTATATASIRSEKGGLSVKAGPFGAPHRGGYVEWDDGVHSAVERVYVTYTKGRYINSIQAVYCDPAGTKVLAPKHGGCGGNTFQVVETSSAITCISGHYDSIGDVTFIRSLKFVMDDVRLVYGPFGSEYGTRFCFSVQGVCGFHGLTGGSELGAIGVHVNSTAKQYLDSSEASVNSKDFLPVKAGPFGGPYENDCVEWDDGSHLAVERIFLTYTERSYINSIQVEYRDQTSTKLLAPKHGDGGGNTFEVIRTSHPITIISGSYDSFGDQNGFIRSLNFHTHDSDTHGPYGLECGTQFSFCAEEGICGLHGITRGLGLWAIGVYVNSTAKQYLDSHSGPAILKELLPIKAGPFGATGENDSVEWDDGSHLAVERIYLTYTKGGHLNSIQVEYGDPNANVLAPKHGGGGGNTFEVVKISSAITWISVHYSSLIMSLKFAIRGGGVKGPYGFGGGTPELCFMVKEGICGFHGVADVLGLKAIGVYVNSTGKPYLGSCNALVKSTASSEGEE